MTRKDRARKRRLATLHTKGQRRAREFALLAARQDAKWIGKDGKRLKRERTGAAYEKALVEAMAARGYLQNGKGGWRRQQTRRTIKQDTMSREAMADG